MKNLFLNLVIMTLIITSVMSVSCSGGATTSITHVSMSSATSSITSSLASISPQDQKIIADVIDAMNEVRSFKLDSDFTEIWRVTSGVTPPSKSVYEWKGSRSVNLSDKEMQMKMDINIDESFVLLNESTSFEMYILGGNQYINIANPSSYSGWTKTALSDNSWESEIQIPLIDELMKTANQVSISYETTDGAKYMVIDLIPKPDALSDWRFSQAQPVGPQAMMSNGLTAITYNDKNDKGSSVKIWVSEDNYLISKVEINTLFEGNINNGGAIPVNPKPEDFITNMRGSDQFQCMVTFSDYNKPVSIQVPEDALNAPLH